MEKRNKVTIYDLPTRIFHWLFAFFFVVAYIISVTVDDDSTLFSYHMMAGLVMVFLLVLRIIWGFVGTEYARFSSFKLNPIELIRYFKEAVVTKTKRYMSHNPASSYAAIIMFTCVTGLAVTGILMAGGNESDLYEELHELSAHLFLITVIVHVSGIFFHQFKHRDSLWSGMVDGKKEAIAGERGISNTKPIVGLLFFVLTLSWIGYLANQYNSRTQTLDLFGYEVTLGEEEHESHKISGDHEEENNDD